MTFDAFRHTRARSLAGLLAALALLQAGLLPAADFETPSTVPTQDILPPAFLRSNHYRIEPNARAEDNFYVFRVHSDYGDYDVTSLAMLRVRLHEIATLAEVTPRLDDTDIRLDRSPAGRRGVGSERVVDILTNPVGTAAQLLGNLQYNVEQTLAGTTSGGPAEAGKGALDLNPDPHKRSAAAQLGVDVYSSNPRLQGLLDVLAEARSAGKTASSISPLVRNVYATPPIGNDGLATRLDSAVKNTDAETLLAELGRRLAALDVAERDRIAFLTHPAYTPRSRLYLVSYLERLAPLAALPQIVTAANSAVTETDALAYVAYARMLAFYRLADHEFAEVVTTARFPTLVDSGRRGVLALPLDYLAWTPNVAEALSALDDIRAMHGLAGFVLLLAGQPSPRIVAELETRGITVHGHYSY
ncbi:MAG: hypothetical protein AB7Q81_01100 [Gammaproteobacteria bacterium]